MLLLREQVDARMAIITDGYGEEEGEALLKQIYDYDPKSTGGGR